MKASNVTRSACERDFILSALQKGVRQDGRQFNDYRKIKISFGESFGHCEVCIGNTRALAQVSCEVVKPSQTRPNEGQLFLNIELSPMASPAFEAGRPSDEAIEVNRFVERCLRESKPIDMESLCIIAGEKVWCLRVDVQILDNTGNILDCACLAAISALSHFRRPDVTVLGKDITIHSFDDKEPIPLAVHHVPICITLGFLNGCEKPIIDATEIEEHVLDGTIAVALNSHMEICCAKMCGVSIIPDQIVMCCRIASSKVGEITEKIKSRLEKDKKKRCPEKEPIKVLRVGDKEQNDILKTVAEPTKIDLTATVKEALEKSSKIVASPKQQLEVSLKGPKIATIGNGGSNQWFIIDDEGDEGNKAFDEIDEKTNKRHLDRRDQIMIEDESEEEETVQLTRMDLDYQKYKTQDDVVVIEQDVMIIEDSTNNTVDEITKQKKRKNKRKKKAQSVQ